MISPSFSETVINASCQCGLSFVTFSHLNSSLPLTGNLCHCNISRQISGVLCTSYIPIPKDSRNPDPDLSTLTPYQSSKILTRYFCSTCGTHMYLHYHADDHFEVAVGTIDKSEGVIAFRRHMWIGDTGDGGASEWIPSISNKAMERWKEDPHESEALRVGWTDPVSTTGNLSRETLLHAHCHCNGVSFHITRPDASSLEASSPFPDLLIPHHLGQSANENPKNEAWWLRDNNTRYLAGICTCTSCRESSGFEFVQWAFVPRTNIIIPSPSSSSSPSPEKDMHSFRNEDFGTLRGYRSSEGVTRRFCQRCGATAFWEADWRPTLIDVAVGLLDAKSGARAEEWLDWVTERVSFSEMGMQRNPGLVGGLVAGVKEWERQRQKENRRRGYELWNLI